MINSYQSIINYEEDEWEDYLTSICLIDIFKPLIDLVKDKSSLKMAIRFIVWTYSKDSEHIVLGDDWSKNKNRIFDKTYLSNDYYEDFVLLKNRIVVETIQRWIDFQDNNTFSNLMSLKDLMIEMRLSSNSALKKTDGTTIDYDQKYKNAGYVQELQKMIADLESELVQNDIKLKDGIKDLKKAKNNLSIGIERYAV